MRPVRNQKLGTARQDEEANRRVPIDVWNIQPVLVAGGRGDKSGQTQKREKPATGEKAARSTVSRRCSGG